MFLERETALAALKEYSAEAGNGDGRVVLVAGEAGAGKTALVEHLQTQLPDARWSWGSCDGLSTPRPLGPLRDIAGTLGGPLARDWRAGATRDQLFDALLDAVGGTDHLDVVVVEDLHWADAATLDMLRFLARRLRGAALLVIGTYRDDALPADAPLRATLGELGRIAGTRRIGIGPLSAAAVATLAGVDGFAAAELHRLTGGNPYFVSELLRAGPVQQQIPGPAALPETARDAVLSRVAVLPRAVRATLECASLLGLRFDPEVVLRLTGGTAADIDAGIDAGLLRADGELPAFRHEITRLAVADAIPAHRRRDLHSRLFGALTAARFEDDAQLAFHAEAAGDLPATVEYGRRAAERARDLGSHREAAAQFTRALAAAEATPDFPARQLAELYEGLSRAASILDRWQVALDADDAARRRWSDLGEPVRSGAALQRGAEALHHLCRGEDARAAADAALRELEPFGETAEYAEACATRALFHLGDGEAADAVGLARRSRAVAVAVGDRRVEVASMITEASALWYSTPSWDTPARAALKIAVAEGLNAEAGRSYALLFGGLTDQRRYAEAEPVGVDAVAYCEEHGLGGHRYFIESQWATALSATGEWAQARRLSARLLAEGDTSPLNRICAQFCLAVIAARSGEPGAAELLAEPTDAADRTDQYQYVVPVHLVGAEVHWIAGDHAGARAEVERAATALQSGGAAVTDPWLAGEVAVWSARLGAPADPADWLAEPYKRELAGEFRAAADWWLAVGCRYDAALTLLGSEDSADLRESLALLDGLGAVATARGARRMLRARGVRSVPAGPRSATRASPAGLTAREAEVLELVSQEQTNAEIARRLVLSPRTVDHHVTAILTKLGVTTRAAAAAEAARQGLLVDAADLDPRAGPARDREPAVT